MTRSNIYTLLCTAVRLAAVALFVESCVSFIATLGASRTTMDPGLRLGTILEPVFQLLLALLLWIFPGVLARLAASRKSLEVFESDFSPAVLQYLAISILGLWFAVTGLSQLVYTAHRWIFLSMYLHQGLADPTVDPKVYGNLLSEAVKTLLGIALALGTRGLVGLLNRVRETGLPPHASEESQS